MSPKKRRRRKARRPDTAHTPRADTGQANTAPHTPARRISRTPVVVTDPPDRKITALWVVLALLWALGTPLALANLLFVVMDLQEAALNVQDPAAPPPQENVDAIGDALVWVLVLALAVPAASAAAALVLRRRIAAIGFTTALVAAALPLLWVMPPAELWDALRAHFLGP
ncbi:hypothetical protein A6A08_18920 [Nocardiopsis sp. TSRI0078]|uniref:hypothetical protein n=1 Tax=unclassified Nocardiopsis TaxID=2649073 RepID=UPI00093F2301|nr:hypothetical protein [Nocardiopsis sp. TSRI0078]OKI23003.1 hypothetical protein A6A08_18920 [Nocardiopsis sp. TSRI0078]